MFADIVAVSALALLVPVANAHMILNSPKPFNYNTDPYVEVNPIDGVEYKYPCQGRGYLADTDITTVVAGGPALLVNWTGTAAHGGGSCQFSISYDDPNASGGWKSDFKFKTIYSLIGGCPASSVGNLQADGVDGHGRVEGPHCNNDSGHECVRSFLIPFPSFLKNGRAIFAWTWHNRIGNREIYMNCAPITITGGTEDQSQIDALPEIFLGNVPAIQSDIPGHTFCSTGQNETVNYPNPGNYGRVLEQPSGPADYFPTSYCSDIRPASALPTFESDSRTLFYASTVTTTVEGVQTGSSATGSVFITIPTDSAGAGAGPTTSSPGVTSYESTTTVTVQAPVTAMDDEPEISYVATVTVTIPASSTVTVCKPKSTGFDGGYGNGGGGETATEAAVPSAPPAGPPGSGLPTVAATTLSINPTPIMITETYNPVDSGPVDSTYLRPCGSTTPTPGDLSACWY